MGAELRKSIRRRFSHYAMLYSVTGTAVCNCIVRDISEGGAKLAVAAAAKAPDELVLVLSRSGTIRRKCRVVWRTESHIGVVFEARQPPVGSS
jgi:hypothetical protein